MPEVPMQVLGLKTGLNIAAVLPVDEFRETDNVLLLTRMGMLKKMPMSRLSNISSAGSRAIGLRVRTGRLRNAMHAIFCSHLARLQRRCI